MAKTAKVIRHCGHCNNKTPHDVVYRAASSKLYDTLFDSDDHSGDVIDTFRYYVVRCNTCEHISLLGGFSLELPQHVRDYPALFPSNPDLPESVPPAIRQAYIEAAKIRVRAPNAFAGQIRKALEYLCKEKNATGRDLFSKLNSLVNNGVLPRTLAEMTDLIREIGNAGVHAGEEQVNIWDAELIDDFFKSVVDYVYVAPAKLERLKSMLANKKSQRKPAQTE